MKRKLILTLGILGFLGGSLIGEAAWAASGADVQARIDHDLAEGQPIVVHVVVALCDNENQGIVPVPPALGNGQEPRSNLYWGALYGVRTHLSRTGDWSVFDSEQPGDERILDRVVFGTSIERNGKTAPLFVVADAWDGAYIQGAIEEYFNLLVGEEAEELKVTLANESKTLRAGCASHAVTYIGHNGLMEFSLEAPVESPQSPTKSTIVLACASKSYFTDMLQSKNVHSMLLTTGLMAPEAYTFDSAVRCWAGGGTGTEVVEAAAGAYDLYQKCGIRGARRLFWSGS